MFPPFLHVVDHGYVGEGLGYRLETDVGGKRLYGQDVDLGYGWGGQII